MKKILILSTVLLTLTSCSNQNTEFTQKPESVKETDNISINQANESSSAETIYELTEIEKDLANVKINISSQEAEKIISNRSNEVVSAIESKDMEKLATFVHPEQGVRFTPYLWVNKDKDHVLNEEQIRNGLSESTKYLWGYIDGSGMPIELTIKEYFDQHVYNYDYASSSDIVFNERRRHGNTYNNTFKEYPDNIIVEYHVPYENSLDVMNWGSLRLVFEEMGETWYLVGIVSEKWTI